MKHDLIRGIDVRSNISRTLSFFFVFCQLNHLYDDFVASLQNLSNFQKNKLQINWITIPCIFIILESFTNSTTVTRILDPLTAMSDQIPQSILSL